MQRSRGAPELAKLLDASENPVGTCTLLVLAWVATCDGYFDPRERERFESIADTTGHGHDNVPIIRMAERGDVGSIALACALLRKRLARKGAALVLTLAIGIAIADQVLLPAENHAIRFLADLFGFTPAQLGYLFKGMTGQVMPEPSDPSSATWWSQQEAQAGARDKEPTTEQQRVEALAILGLVDPVNAADVKKAFRRLAAVHHPDRFASLGDEAVKVATTNFQRIRDAYEYLNSHA